jgi:hypothetical protein
MKQAVTFDVTRFALTGLYLPFDPAKDIRNLPRWPPYNGCERGSHSAGQNGKGVAPYEISDPLFRFGHRLRITADHDLIRRIVIRQINGQILQRPQTAGTSSLSAITAPLRPIPPVLPPA